MRPFALASALLLSGCALLPGGGEEDPERNPKLECDQYASQAVQADDLETAKNLSARAAECYAAAQQRQQAG